MNDVYKKKAPYTLKEKRAIVGLDTLKTLEDIVEKYMTEHAESVSACEVDAFCELKITSMPVSAFRRSGNRQSGWGSKRISAFW